MFNLLTKTVKLITGTRLDTLVTSICWVGIISSIYHIILKPEDISFPLWIIFTEFCLQVMFWISLQERTNNYHILLILKQRAIEIDAKVKEMRQYPKNWKIRATIQYEYEVNENTFQNLITVALTSDFDKLMSYSSTNIKIIYDPQNPNISIPFIFYPKKLERHIEGTLAIRQIIMIIGIGLILWSLLSG